MSADSSIFSHVFPFFVTLKSVPWTLSSFFSIQSNFYLLENQSIKKQFVYLHQIFRKLFSPNYNLLTTILKYKLLRLGLLNDLLE